MIRRPSGTPSLKTFAFASVVAAVTAAYAPAYGAVSINGTQLVNGLPMNGIFLNGSLPLNGLTANGFSTNTTALQPVRLLLPDGTELSFR